MPYRRATSIVVWRKSAAPCAAPCTDALPQLEKFRRLLCANANIGPILQRAPALELPHPLAHVLACPHCHPVARVIGRHQNDRAAAAQTGPRNSRELCFTAGADRRQLMSRRVMIWSLWVVLVLTVPLPYFMIETGRVPAAQLFLFAALTAPLALSDPGFTTRFVATLFLAQSLFYGVVLYAVARAVGRTVRPSRRMPVLLALVLILAVAALALELYRAPLSHGPGRTNLLGVFW